MKKKNNVLFELNYSLNFICNILKMNLLQKNENLINLSHTAKVVLLLIRSFSKDYTNFCPLLNHWNLSSKINFA